MRYKHKYVIFCNAAFSCVMTSLHMEYAQYAQLVEQLLLHNY